MSDPYQNPAGYSRKLHTHNSNARFEPYGKMPTLIYTNMCYDKRSYIALQAKIKVDYGNDCIFHISNQWYFKSEIDNYKFSMNDVVLDKRNVFINFTTDEVKKMKLENYRNLFVASFLNVKNIELSLMFTVKMMIDSKIKIMKPFKFCTPYTFSIGGDGEYWLDESDETNISPLIIRGITRGSERLCISDLKSHLSVTSWNRPLLFMTSTLNAYRTLFQIKLEQMMCSAMIGLERSLYIPLTRRVPFPLDLKKFVEIEKFRHVHGGKCFWVPYPHLQQFINYHPIHLVSVVSMGGIEINMNQTMSGRHYIII